MNYTNFQIFKNKYKKTENQPDYKISTKVGEKFEEIGAGWIKSGKNGDKYISCKLNENPYPVLTEIEKNEIRRLKDEEMKHKKEVESIVQDNFDIF